MEPIILGIDPGMSGAICAIRLSDFAVDIIDMPHFEIKTPKRKKVLNKKTGVKETKDVTQTRKLADFAGMARAMRLPGFAVLKAGLEKVGPMPLDGVIQAFTFGESYGAIQMCLAARQCPVETPRPVEWKKYFKLNADKDASRRLALQKAPCLVDLLARVSDDGRAEAFLIALYTLETHGIRQTLPFCLSDTILTPALL